jgi:hypothetical protein
MRNPVRVTIAFDEESYGIFRKLKERLRQSQSEIIRNALRFYYAHQDLEDYDIGKVKIYVEMLSEGEHIILDIDHWIAFLRFIDTHPDKEKFWEFHKDVARSHAEQFRGKTPEYILERLEACNFFRINRTSENEFTLILGNETGRYFIKTFLEEVFEGVGIDAEIKEDLTKIRVKVH